MKPVLFCVFFAVLICPGSNAQQDPPRPPGATPLVPGTEVKLPPDPKPAGTTKLPPDPKPGDAKAVGATPDAPGPETKTPPPAAVNIDPMRMAPPKVGDASKPGGPVDDSTYILGAEDQIAILVNNSPEFNGSHLIRPDGRVTVNLVGEIMAAGNTPEQLTDALREKLKKYVVDPDVSISVLGVNSKRYFIQGEVNHPGEFKLVVPTKVLEALVNAGGFRDFAKQKDIVIIREEGTSTKRLHFNYKEVIKGKHLDQNIFLKAGDIIVVR
ncbi:MAG TPA: polysaccharide biosynthesis/export family protein [Candidatus Solibacter sp.]|nr:polysaccharide biosynthesis/export family protein [Candidatus Solibacter sp.]